MKKDKKITGFENIEILDMGGSIRYTLRYTEKSDISAFDNFSIRYVHPCLTDQSFIFFPQKSHSWCKHL